MQNFFLIIKGLGARDVGVMASDLGLGARDLRGSWQGISVPGTSVSVSVISVAQEQIYLHWATRRGAFLLVLIKLKSFENEAQRFFPTVKITVLLLIIQVCKNLCDSCLISYFTTK